MLQASFFNVRVGRTLPPPPVVPAHLVSGKLRVSHASPRPFEKVEKKSHPTQANLGF